MKNLAQHKHAPRGFTLIELLIVVAIIAILASILFPVFIRARENARRSGCQSNLKQIGLGILQYAQDSDEIMVPAWQEGGCDAGQGWQPTNDPGFNCNSSPEKNLKWMDMIYPYVKSEQIFNCPSVSSTYISRYVQANGNKYGHYAANLGYRSAGDMRNPPFSYYTKTAGESVPINLAKIQAPATTVMVTETRGWSSSGVASCVMTFPSSSGSIANSFDLREIGEDTQNSDTKTIRTWVYSNNNPDGAIGERHLETINVLWADGHVKAVKLATISPNLPAGNKLFPAWTIEDD